jgi:hypothetical protein
MELLTVALAVTQVQYCIRGRVRNAVESDAPTIREQACVRL